MSVDETVSIPTADAASPERIDETTNAKSSERLGLGRWLPALHVSLLVVATFATYWPSLGGSFVFDDHDVITKRAKSGEIDVVRIPLVQGLRAFGDLSFSLNYWIGGVDPFGYRLTNVAIHALAAVVLYDLVRRTLLLPRMEGRFAGTAAWLALGIAATWALHPLNTQAVAYVVQRYESLMGLCFLLTLYAVLRADLARSRPVGVAWRIAALVFLGLGLGTKEVMIAAPLVVLLYERVFLAESWGAVLRSWAWAGPLAAIVLVVAAIKIVGVLGSSEVVGFDLAEITWAEYLRSQPAIVLHYLRLLVWPAGQAADYQWPVANDPLSIVATGVFLLTALAATIYAYFRWPRMAFLAIAFLAIIAPTSSFVPVADLAFEHRMYLSSACAIALLAFAGWLIASRFVPPNRAGRIVAGFLALAAVPLAATTVARNAVYADEIAFWEDVTAKRPENYRGWANLGNAYSLTGRHGDAVDALARAVSLRPDFVPTRILLAIALEGLPPSDPRPATAMALEEARQALARAPDDAAANHALARILRGTDSRRHADEAFRKAIEANPHEPAYRFNHGRYLLEENRFDEAATVLRDLETRWPEFPNAAALREFAESTSRQARAAGGRFIARLPGESEHDFGRRLERLGDLPKAIEFYKQSVDANADDPEALPDLVRGLILFGRIDMARDEASRALDRDDEGFPELYARGLALAASGEFPRALDAYDAAREVRPADARLAESRGIALAALGRLDDAESELRSAVQFAPLDVSPRMTLAALLTAADDKPGALKEYEALLQLHPDLKVARDARDAIRSAAP